MLDSQLLLARVLNCDRMSIIINRDTDVAAESSKRFFALIEQRKAKKPLKYITNSAEFMGIELYVKEGVLIPRPDTEVLVEEVLKEVKKENFISVCDVCCGSGAIAISLAKHNPSVRVKCCDIAEAAEEVTKKNIELLAISDRVEFYRSDLLDFAIKTQQQFEVIVSNPPYIKTTVIPTLMEDVKDYEPYIALWGGDDGLDFYRKITEQSKVVLRSGGLLAYEIGYDQGEQVSSILADQGFKEVRVVKDLAGLDRVVMGIKN
jgi:release factor glutamine methyltransferase